MINSDCLVIVPAYNEAQNLAKVIEELKLFFKNILVIDDGSNDASLDIIKKLDIYYITHFVNLGQGAALDTGFNFFVNESIFNYVITFDGDGQNRAIDAKNMIDFAKKKKLSAVLGTRFKNKENSKEIPFNKKMILYLGTLYEKIFFNINLSDAHNGLRVLDKKLVKNHILPIKNFDMNHATEISYKIFKSKCNLAEYPVRVNYYNKSSQNPINAINIALKNFFKPL